MHAFATVVVAVGCSVTHEYWWVVEGDCSVKRHLEKQLLKIFLAQGDEVIGSIDR